MSLAMRYGACGSFFFASVLLLASLFLPVQEIDPLSTDPIDAGVWTIEGGMLGADGNRTRSGSWYDDAHSGQNGIFLLRAAGPMLIVGMLVLMAAGSMVLSGQGVRTGWTATAGLVVSGLAILAILWGLSTFAKSVTAPTEVLDSDITPLVGFWAMFLALLVGTGAALVSFSVKPEARGRIGPDGQPLPPLPVLSVENPEAFQPMANRDPRPFRPEEDHYMSFEVTGGRRTFQAKEEKMEEPDEETTWEDVERKATTPPANAATAKGSKPAKGGQAPAPSVSKATPAKPDAASGPAKAPAATSAQGAKAGPGATAPGAKPAPPGKA